MTEVAFPAPEDRLTRFEFPVLEPDYDAPNNSPGEIQRPTHRDGPLYSDLCVTQIVNWYDQQMIVQPVICWDGAFVWHGNCGRRLNFRKWWEDEIKAVNDYDRDDLRMLDSERILDMQGYPTVSRHKNDGGRQFTYRPEPRILQPGDRWNHWAAYSIEIDPDSPTHAHPWYPLLRNFKAITMSWTTEPTD